jgi:hypothetical protein
MRNSIHQRDALPDNSQLKAFVGLAKNACFTVLD